MVHDDNYVHNYSGHFYNITISTVMITNGSMNVTACSGTKANISCGYTGVDPLRIKPNWRIIKRNDNGDIISNVTVSADGVFDDNSDVLEFVVVVVRSDSSADGSYLSVGPVDDTYNNTSYQCIFTINDNISESDTAGTITVIGMYESGYVTLNLIFSYITRALK